MIVFKGTWESETDATLLDVGNYSHSEVKIALREDEDCMFICIDVETAIQVRKQLSKAIGIARNGGENV